MALLLTCAVQDFHTALIISPVPVSCFDASPEGRRVGVGHFANCCNAHVFCRPTLRVLAMAERAIILIPDISGFTGFTGATEIDHAAHIASFLSTHLKGPRHGPTSDHPNL